MYAVLNELNIQIIKSTKRWAYFPLKNTNTGKNPPTYLGLKATNNHKTENDFLQICTNPILGRNAKNGVLSIILFHSSTVEK